MENPSNSYGASPAIWDHTALQPQAGTRPRFTYPGEKEG